MKQKSTKNIKSFENNDEKIKKQKKLSKKELDSLTLVLNHT